MTKTNYKPLNDALEKHGDTNLNNWIRLGSTRKKIELKQAKLNGVTLDQLTQDHCQCGIQIKYNYFIQHKKTKQILVIGSSCINQFGGRKNIKTMCITCKNPFKKKGYISCKSCRRINKQKKLIHSELEKEIKLKIRNDKKKLQQKIKCLNCFKLFKHNNKFPSDICYHCKFRKCNICKKRCIKTDSSYKTCYKCFIHEADAAKKNFSNFAFVQ